MEKKNVRIILEPRGGQFMNEVQEEGLQNFCDVYKFNRVE
jgi:hypothetical protein